VALLGDAAHPMRPYMAQGAGMAIEDAAELARSLAMTAVDVPTRLRRYAQARWQRVARVQARSMRNGEIFMPAGWCGWGATPRSACWASACWTCPGCIRAEPRTAAWSSA
jgi:salicylate hydroxylase